MQRRDFLRSSAVLSAGLAAAQPLSAFSSPPPPERRFRISLSPGAIGVRGSTAELLARASSAGFEALAADIGSTESLSKPRLHQLRDEAAELGLAWGSSGLPVEFRATEDRFQQDLAQLPARAAALQELGVTRIGTWIMPCHPTRDYLANFALHTERLGQIADVLHDHGLRFGLEYVGPKTLRDSQRYDFVASGAQLRELIQAIDRPNVGVILDSFHWYCAEEDADELRNWRNEDIVAVDLNDACAHFGPQEQIDGIRELPGATGKIDLATFLGVLRELGYDGPVRAEPFSDTLNAMDDDLAMQATVAALRSAIGT
jgi:sugar phosphate isomerase/epimerase